MIEKYIPEELDELIKEYVSDGVLSDKERIVIMRKAMNLNLDIVELDVYIDALLQEKAKSKKRKNKIIGFLVSKWAVCIYELIIIISMYTYMDNIESRYREIYRNKHGNRSAVWSDVKTAEGYKICIAIGGVTIFLITASLPASFFEKLKTKDPINYEHKKPI